MAMKNEIEEALHARALWRKQFKDFLNGRASFDLATAGATDQCIFGEWLDNEGYRMMPPELHDEIRAVHKEFPRSLPGSSRRSRRSGSRKRVKTFRGMGISIGRACN